MSEVLNRLLVIDDQPDLCEFIAEVAIHVGYEVRAVTDAAAFRRTFEEFRPTLVVLDLQMPEADGIELLRFLAEHGSRAHVLVASGMDSRILQTAEQVGRSRGLSMLGALRKPILLADLEMRLRSVLSSEPQIEAEDIERALRAAQFAVHYQPKAVRKARGKWIIEGVEALTRWRHPELGPVSPARFIPLAERYGLISRLTDYVLEAAFRQARDWDALGLSLSTAINLSPQLINDLGFPDRVARLAEDMGVDARRIVFEITESAAMADPATSMDVLTRLRVKNFGLSIDDFGTGYSSLKQLYLMPFSELKIDNSFVLDLSDNDDARVMVETMVLLAHKLHLTVCAEGVETQASLDFLDDCGCDRAQGYFIGRPMPGEAIPQCVRTWNAAQGDDR